MFTAIASLSERLGITAMIASIGSIKSDSVDLGESYLKFSDNASPISFMIGLPYPSL